MNRETRRMIEREERRQKNKEGSGRGAGGRGPGGRPPAGRPQGGGGAGEAATTEKKSLFRRIVDYLHEVRVEMRKVSWPTSEQMIVFTAVTMITSIALTLLIFGMDFGLKNVVLWVIDGGISG